jgi:hypothetical protein
VGLVLAILVPWLAAVWGLWRMQQPAPRGGIGHDTESRAMAKPGPWGKLSYVEVEMRAPERCSLDQCRTNLPRWFFDLPAQEDVSHFLSRSGCSEAQAAELLRTAKQQGNGWQVSPTLALICDLTPDTRAKVYSYLSQFAENPDHRYAVRWTPGEFTHWLASARFEPATADLIRQFVYGDGTHLFLADEAALTLRLADNSEKLKLLEAVLWTKALVVTLHVDPGSDVTELAEYWGTGGRVRQVEPILEALASRPDGGETDIANLLPPLPQTRLYTYTRVQGPLFDCHWSAFNFFSEKPDASIMGADRLQQVFRDEYRLVNPSEARLGDLVLFRDSSGQVMHSAVFIADDILFTKNGISPKKPWVLMKFSEVQNIFWQMPSIVFARRKA